MLLPATPRAPSRRLARSAAPIALIFAAGAVAQEQPERFAPLPGSVMLDDAATALEGEIVFEGALPYEIISGYAVAEGDMVLGRIGPDGRLPPRLQRRGLGQTSLFERWPDGIVPYAFHDNISDLQRRNVEQAIAHIAQKTRIAMVARDSERAAPYGDYILFERSESSCASYVGRQTHYEAQSLWVSDGCSVGSIVHEIAHAIGLFHEHTRPDRDNYIAVDWNQIIPEKEFNFEIYDAGAQAYGNYDHGSIMHYGEYFFSATGERTIIAPENVEIGQRSALSDGDVDAIDRMYATDLEVDAAMHLSERGLEIDVSVTNLGSLGAHTLTLEAVGPASIDWQSISADSGWDCLAYGRDLRCERERLIEQQTSRFTLIADPETAEADDIGLRLEARTLDTDSGNNVVNSAAFGDLRDGTPALGAAESGSDAEPETILSAFSTDRAVGLETPASDGGGGGASGPAALGALALLVLTRRRRRRS